MRVVVSVASRHGATREIGTVIAQAFTDAGIDCDQVEPADLADVSGYDAVVIGSAVYLAEWLPEARDLVERIGPQLVGKPVWLLSSGLAGTPSKRGNSSLATTARIADLQARGHRHFPGKLDLLDLTLTERVAVLAARGKYGDNRDLTAVRAWGDQLAAELISSETRSA